jgi:hypothetical protein
MGSTIRRPLNQTTSIASTIDPSTPMPISHDVLCMAASTMSDGIASPMAQPL